MRVFILISRVYYLYYYFLVAELPSCRVTLGKKIAECPVTYENSC